MTFVRQDAIEQVADHVTELVDPSKHVEEYEFWTDSRHRKKQNHITEHGSLLDQLRAQLPPGGPDSDTDAPIGRGATSGRLPLAVDVLDVLLRIEAGSAWWTSVQLRRDLRETVEDNLRLLVGSSTRMEDHELRMLAKDIHHWHCAAATLTGWQSPPFTPRAACPLCGQMGSLRINPDQRRGLCVQCRVTWDETNIGLLADEIKMAAPQDARAWRARCEHSWRLTVVSPLGISARCVVCHGMETRRVWPRGTPAWTELDALMRGASA